ncbi:hypothetical protein HUJ04_010686 [Dendroctonus ponderosae]|nr:hypothetical protein HUJ04_010686 [Dendroctonus ponderosae]
MNISVKLAVIFCISIRSAFGHGYMYSPINRASRWRLEPTNWNITHNYEDNQYFCGGFAVQYSENEGKCGPCGDDWSDPVPRSKENGGTYGNGVVVASYLSGSLIKTDIRIQPIIEGIFPISKLCVLNDTLLPETEDCFQPVRLLDGSFFQKISSEDYNVTSYIKLPLWLTCDRCVLRWHYSTGNNWGVCDNGTSALGCGPQKTFRSCADIAIIQPTWWRRFNFLNNYFAKII